MGRKTAATTTSCQSCSQYQSSKTKPRPRPPKTVS